jgi:hypothetical protein
VAWRVHVANSVSPVRTTPQRPPCADAWTPLVRRCSVVMAQVNAPPALLRWPTPAADDIPSCSSAAALKAALTAAAFAVVTPLTRMRRPMTVSHLAPRAVSMGSTDFLMASMETSPVMLCQPASTTGVAASPVREGEGRMGMRGRSKGSAGPRCSTPCTRRAARDVCAPYHC